MFSSVKISTHKYCKIKKTLFFILYIILYMHIVLFFHNVFQRHKKSFWIIKMKLHHCITLKKPLRKTISLYIIVTVSCETYLGIIQSMKRKSISSAANMWKNYTLDTHFVSCLFFFFRTFWTCPISLS